MRVEHGFTHTRNPWYWVSNKPGRPVLGLKTYAAVAAVCATSWGLIWLLG